MAIRGTLVASLAAFFAVSTPVLMADNDKPALLPVPPLETPVIQQDTQMYPDVMDNLKGAWAWVQDKTVGISEAATDKVNDLTDPEHKIASLKEELLVKDKEIEELYKKLAVQDYRITVQDQDRETLIDAVSDIHYLAKSGRLAGLIKGVDADADTSGATEAQ